MPCSSMGSTSRSAKWPDRAEVPEPHLLRKARRGIQRLSGRLSLPALLLHLVRPFRRRRLCGENITHRRPFADERASSPRRRPSACGLSPPEGCIYSDHAADLGFVPSALMDTHQVDPLGNVSAGAPRQRGACRSRITLAGPGGKPAGAFDEKPNVGTFTKDSSCEGSRSCLQPWAVSGSSASLSSS